MTAKQNRPPVPAPDERDFHYWEKIKDIIDQLIDTILNYRQSGHPGGSRSKLPILLSLLLSGAMRWDPRDPAQRFGDRFILSAGHTVPLIYCTLAVFNEALLQRHQRSGEAKYALPSDPHQVLTWEDLLGFRQMGGLSGHAEMEGKTLFLKFNTGPSGHGSAAAVGEALALKRAGATGVKVFALEGEGGLTPGVNHEAMNSAYGLNLDNLFFLVDWNDYGIDNHRYSQIIYGDPNTWFSAHGWNVRGTPNGEDWRSITDVLLGGVAEKSNQAPAALWFQTRKGRGYLKYDNASHGSPHAMNSALFWETKRAFQEKYGVRFENFGSTSPSDRSALGEEFRKNLEVIISVLRADTDLVDYLSDRLVQIAESMPTMLPDLNLGAKGNPLTDPALRAFEDYPADLYTRPGEKRSNRDALYAWGAWVNTFAAQKYGQPVFIACSADLADSTKITGFGAGYGDFQGYGWYERTGTPEGVLLPQAITEMVNAGLLCGMASVNFSEKPTEEFMGFWGACSTYGSFSYLKYGMFRLFSQLAQGCQLKIGKVLWIAGHSGPETADDSRTHFGIFAPGVTQLFPKGSIINLYPWEYNEVPVLLGAALRQDVPIISLHLTRPAITIPDRQALGMASHFEAAKGAYIARDYIAGAPKDGTLIVQGTSAMANLVSILPELERRKWNLKIVYAASPELFALQPQSYQECVLTAADKMDSTVITTQARALMRDWMFNYLAEEYALSADWDDRWRTGGALDDVLEEAHLSPRHLLTGIERFVSSRKERLARLKADLASVE